MARSFGGVAVNFHWLHEQTGWLVASLLSKDECTGPNIATDNMFLLLLLVDQISTVS